ncbi:hypothetical protein ACE3MZ_21720 [Paenibacillus sp. WLX1005]|uniref:hypothetical protein n=1 Tax=Paenibacillus sp. WLX1005 TaxID=3243766 RepID=UPI0039840703
MKTAFSCSFISSPAAKRLTRNFGGILASTLISIIAGAAFTADNFHELTMVLIGLAVVYGAVLYGRQRMSNSTRNRQGQYESK